MLAKQAILDTNRHFSLSEIHFLISLNEFLILENDLKFITLILKIRPIFLVTEMYFENILILKNKFLILKYIDFCPSWLAIDWWVLLFEIKEIFVFPTLLIDIHLFDIQRLIFEIHTSFLKFKDLSMKFYSLKLQLYSLKLKDDSLSVEFHIFFFEFKDISSKFRDYSNFNFWFQTFSLNF